MQTERLFDLLALLREKYLKDDMLAAKQQGQWHHYSTGDYIEKSNMVSYGLLALGLKPQDTIAIITNNRPEWNFVDMGSLQAGIVNVPVYPTISSEDYDYIINHCKPKVIFFSDKGIYLKIKNIIEKAGFIKEVYSFNKVEGVTPFDELLSLGKENQSRFIGNLEEIKASVKADDLATIIYTSGTTGFPKGVMLSHANIMSNVKVTAGVHELNQEHKALSFLPLCHIYERMMNYHFQYKGISIYYAENFGTIAENIREVKPHVFNTVPRLLETVYDKIIGKGNELPSLQKKIFFWSVNLGLKFNLNRANGWWYHLKLALADKLVFRKWREALGGNIELIVSGGAALQVRLSKIFWAAGIRVYEGYGLTETSPVIAVNNPVKKEVMFGTVGPVLDGIQVKLSEEGEILCKGTNIMMGYYKEPGMTKEVIDDEGWFKTGDVGEIIKGKYLRISDRKKEIFKLSSGKYIAPQVIENKFKESLFIEQIMVIGENQKFASALISPNFTYLHNWAYHQQLEFRDNTELINLPEVIAIFQDEVNEINKTLGATEQIKRFRLVCEEWKPETGELSPTLKLKRTVLTKKYESLINEIFFLDKKDEEEERGIISRLSRNIVTSIKNIRKKL